jgi:hypothetical protein
MGSVAAWQLYLGLKHGLTTCTRPADLLTSRDDLSKETIDHRLTSLTCTNLAQQKRDAGNMSPKRVDS